MPEPVCACGRPLATHGRTCPPKPASGHQAPDPEPVDHLPNTLPPGTSCALIKAALDTTDLPTPEVAAVWGADAVKCDCGPEFDKDSNPRDPTTWHHRDFHLQTSPIDPLAAAGHTEQTTRQIHNQAVQHRNQLIRQAVQDGRTLREVGEAVGLSHVAVRNIAEKDKP